jgi:divalent metal cation (Fe/Co/Zn/Cd) transporter
MSDTTATNPTAANTATAHNTLPADHRNAVRTAQRLNRLTIGWNVVEGFVAVGAGLAAGSLSLVSFGIDSGIEVSAALVLTWRLAERRQDGCQDALDRKAQRAIALCFAGLASYVLFVSIANLVAGHRPDASVPGIIVAILSLLIMPVLARAKRRAGRAMGSQAAVAEASQTDLCTMLSAALLVGLGANAAFGWWWADSMTAMVIGVVAAVMAVRTWNAPSLTDACCG